ncbi:hypothetical protein TWF281_002588 [Arthrobotrys megalospora]
MRQLSTAEICGIILGILFFLCLCIGALIWILQNRRDGQKSRIMVTMTGTTIRHKNGRTSVLEATWIPTGVGPGNAYYRNDLRRVSTVSDTPDSPLEVDRSIFPRNTVKRSSYMSAKKLEIPEALTEEDPDYDQSASEKGSSDSPSVESGAITPADMQAPKIHIQDFDAQPIRSSEFGGSFDINNLLQSVNSISTGTPDEKAAIHAV